MIKNKINETIELLYSLTVRYHVIHLNTYTHLLKNTIVHISVEVSADLSGWVFQQDVDSPIPSDQTLSLFGGEVHSTAGRFPIPAQQPNILLILLFLPAIIITPFPILLHHGYPQRTSL